MKMEISTLVMNYLQVSLVSLLFLHTILTYLPLALSCVLSTCFLYSLFYYYCTRPDPVYMLNYACYTPPKERKCTFKVAESFVRGSAHFTPTTIDFMHNIYHKSGLGDETYAPPFLFEPNQTPTLKCATQETEEGVYSAVNALFGKTNITPQEIDLVIVTCGSFSPSPSISSLIVNRYKLKPNVKTYNLSGMGCSSGILSIDMAARILCRNKNVRNALVVITESITLNWYEGDERSMLVTNCIFRVGCAAALLTNDPNRRGESKMELVHSLRTHHGADDPSYQAAFQEEDGKGKTGISLKKDLIRVAGMNLRDHIKILAPRVLPLSQLAGYVYLKAASMLSDSKPVVPNFTTAFEHMCVHTGGKAVIEQVGRVLKLGDEVTEPARMTLHRFGNTSSSLVFYELAYFEAKRRVKRGDRMWMIAFGTGFKVGSLVWKWIGEDSKLEGDNPWVDCIGRYPLKVW